jgi:hypothetical protein
VHECFGVTETYYSSSKGFEVLALGVKYRHSRFPHNVEKGMPSIYPSPHHSITSSKPAARRHPYRHRYRSCTPYAVIPDAKIGKTKRLVAWKPIRRSDKFLTAPAHCSHKRPRRPVEEHKPDRSNNALRWYVRAARGTSASSLTCFRVMLPTHAPVAWAIMGMD